MDFPSPHATLLPMLPSLDLQNTLSACHGIPRSMASDQGTLFTAHEVGQRAYAHEIHWSYHVPHRHAVAGLMEWWNGFLTT